ncbi:hypothetical protein N7495_006743 [Penicillium taxi]|uniref:uncharacterized protein n=1 Tax=Penicillium taxi TaxID=168475 RepID=UPI002545A90F|nr:uncharacterized protein N7495_006743 [Penicillium taxi]KAJ5895052.1 hypothetical protein N7495_006743 [Penicillium taxi]
MGLAYAYHKAIALFLRGLVKPRLHLNPKPDETVSIPSRQSDRTIKTHVYKSASKKTPSPVLVNFCGSGFVLRTFGTDDEYCRLIADQTDYTVIDVQYRLAPEHPFPAAFEDAEDVVTWIRSQPDRFDLSHLSLSGFSAGGNIALAISSSSSLFKSTEKGNIFNTVISFYGITDMALETPIKPMPDTSNFIMRRIFPSFSHLCHKCLLMNGADPTDLRMSPGSADPQNFPDHVLIITAAQCSFAIEGEKLAEKIGSLDGGIEGKLTVCCRMDGCAHGWDKEVVRGTSQCKAKDEAYTLAVEMLQTGVNQNIEA